MKKYYLLIVLMAFFANTSLFAQSNYEMVVEMKNGAKSNFKSGEIKQVYFNNSGGDDTPTGVFQGAKRVFGNNRLKAFGEEGHHRYEFTFDNDGFVTSFRYIKYNDDGSIKKNYNYLCSYDAATFVASAYEGERYMGSITATIGANGFVSKLVGIGGSTILFEYNSDNQLTKMTYQKSGHDDEWDLLTYQNGDIIRDEWDDGHPTTISYITPSNTTPINNVAGVMEYDHSMHIDMDDNVMGYYCGAFGFGTKHLPLAWVHSGSSESSCSNAWTFDNQNRAIKLVTTENSYGTETTRTFYWEWE